jgi:hypothetical protein
MKNSVLKLPIILISTLALWHPTHAQKQAFSKADIDFRVQQTPNKATHSVATLSAALTSGLTNDEAKAYAIYTWVAHNLTYDRLAVENVTTYASLEEVTDEALTTRMGVCMHYAQLFGALASEAQIPSLVVTGYVKPEAEIYKIPHAWNALKIDGDWYFFDPTWGSGYMDGNTGIYRNEYSDEYFKIAPAQMIKTHMPFDPLVQMLNYPRSNSDFASGSPPADSAAFDYLPELERYLLLPEEKQLAETLARMEKQGIANEMMQAHYASLRHQYKVHLANQQVLQHNNAVYKLNDVIGDYNKYVAYSNSHRSNTADELSRKVAWLQRIEQNALAVKLIFDTLTVTTDLKQNLYANQKSLQALLRTIADEQRRLKERSR